MSSFINNLIDRSVAPATDIQPRLRGKFERAAAPSKSFNTEESASAVSGALQPSDENRLQRTDLVRKIHVTNLVENHSEEISPIITQRPWQKNQEQSLPDTKPERSPRFEPSYNLVVPTQQNFSEKNDSSVYQQPRSQPVNRDDENKQQVSTYQPEASPNSTTITKEVYKPLPVVKPTANNSFRIEPNQKTQQKQSPVASFIQKQTANSPSRTINISIGRIEVRVSQPPVSSPAKPKKEGVAIMGLDEYLQKRNQRSQ
jgi:hypothetical protein